MIPTEMKLFKVVGPEGQAVHGGSLNWSLPENDKPGKWHSVKGEIEVCHRGLHLTPSPIDFWLPNSRVFEAEYRGDVDDSQLGQKRESKVAVREARLVREVAWTEHCVWIDGEHELREGLARASGSATVRAYDSATVRAYDSATVEASGSATVEAYDSATVRAYGSVNVVSTVYHSPSATVALADLAAHIDRRERKLELRKAVA